jgi:hypothetical protein
MYRLNTSFTWITALSDLSEASRSSADSSATSFFLEFLLNKAIVESFNPSGKKKLKTEKKIKRRI